MSTTDTTTPATNPESAGDFIPVVSSIDEIYTSGSLLTQGKRWDGLVREFEKRYGGKPKFVARAPGRVNVIGEHIDYCGLGVLPAAIERDVLIACSVTPSSSSSEEDEAGGRPRIKIYLANVDERWPTREFEFEGGSDGVIIDRSNLEWSNYFRAGLKGVLAAIPPLRTSQELRLLFTGNVPPGGGLSSSSAMTTCSSVAVVTAFGARESVDRSQLTEIAIASERWVGVNSGGMDQTASVFGQRSHLLHIEFVPTLLPTPVPMPQVDPPISFVIANTLVAADKHTTAKFNYNLRVVETRVGAYILSKHLNLSPPQNTYKLVIDNYFSSSSSAPSTAVPSTTSSSTRTSNSIPVSEHVRRLQFMLEKVDEVFSGQEGVSSWGWVLKELGGISMDDFRGRFQGGFEIEADDGLKLWARAKHVLSEGLRVYLFRDLLESSTGTEGTTLVQRLGDLMNESQKSCKEEYECSCPEIDDIVDIARKNGSFGSRLTGAGWGGCTVHLIPEGIEKQFIQALRKEYYAKRFPDLGEEALDAALFSTKPESGACVYLV